MKFPIPDLIVEVLSESTEVRDRGVKFEDFEANGVEEYWIAYADDSTVEQYLLIDGKLRLHRKSNDGMLESKAITGLTIPVPSLFEEQANLESLRALLSITGS